MIDAVATLRGEQFWREARTMSSSLLQRKVDRVVKRARCTQVLRQRRAMRRVSDAAAATNAPTCVRQSSDAPAHTAPRSRQQRTSRSCTRSSRGLYASARSAVHPECNEIARQSPRWRKWLLSTAFTADAHNGIVGDRHPCEKHRNLTQYALYRAGTRNVSLFNFPNEV
jgi:hypothetical protein